MTEVHVCHIQNVISFSEFGEKGTRHFVFVSVHMTLTKSHIVQLSADVKYLRLVSSTCVENVPQ